MLKSNQKRNLAKTGGRGVSPSPSFRTLCHLSSLPAPAPLMYLSIQAYNSRRLKKKVLATMRHRSSIVCLLPTRTTIWRQQ